MSNFTFFNIQLETNKLVYSYQLVILTELGFHRISELVCYLSPSQAQEQY